MLWGDLRRSNPYRPYSQYGALVQFMLRSHQSILFNYLEEGEGIEPSSPFGGLDLANRHITALSTFLWIGVPRYTGRLFFINFEIRSGTYQ